MSAVARLSEYRHCRATREADRLAFEEQRQHGLRLRRETKLRRLAEAQPDHGDLVSVTEAADKNGACPARANLTLAARSGATEPTARNGARAAAHPDRMAIADAAAAAPGAPAGRRPGRAPARLEGVRPNRQQRVQLAGPGTAAPDDQDTFELGPPVDAILDTPYDPEIFDDCAYDTVEEEYPCDQEAC